MSSSYGANNNNRSRNWSPGSTSMGSVVNNNRLYRAPREFSYGPIFPSGTILPGRILVLPRGEMPYMVNPRLRQFIQDLTPTMETNPWPTQLPLQEDRSNLHQEDQTFALKNLRKTIYNPPPPKTKKKWCLYYRDNVNGILNKEEEMSDEDVKGCVICLEDFVPHLEVIITPCNHMFHEDCIVPWAKSHGRCPICRSAISETNNINNNYNNENGARNDIVGGDLISLLRAMELERMAFPH